MASTTMFVSCGSDDSDGGPAVTGVVLTVSSTSVDLGQSVTLTAKDNNGEDVTADVVFYDGTTVVTSPYTLTTPGAHSLTAKLDTFTSPAVVVNGNVAANTVFANGTSNVTDISIMYYLGSTEAGANVFVANPYNQVGTGETATYPNDIYVYFTSAQEAGSEFLTLPELGNYAFGLPTSSKVTIDANVFINSQEILETEVTTDANWNLEALTVDETAQSWDFTYGIKLANGSYVYGDFSGDFEFVNQAGRNSARSSAGSKIKVVTVTPAELQANLDAVLAKNKK
ncbi:hypothetical protein [Flavobacterium soli]|uniref:hypothetical protein n=1 Tax=Flavobacterium soli TaxID=344881 RepID=UPI0012FB1722|nr:hypothetical protein [Flavobacterium soli]